MSRTPISNLQPLWQVTASSLSSMALAGMLLATLAISALAADGDVVPSFAPQLIRGGEVTQVVLQPDGKILLVGRFTTINGILRPYLARLNPNGSLDPSFSPAVSANISSILLQPDGKILIPGTTTRLNSNGTVDSTFQPGKTLYLAVLPNGKIIASGLNYSYMTGLVRLSANGAIEVDQTTASGGNVVSITVAESQPDGKILFAGQFFNYFNQPRPGFARLNADWTLDAFPSGTATSSGGGFLGNITQIASLSNGKIYIAGSFSNYDGIARPGLARLNADGTLDTSFDPPQTDGNILKMIPMPNGGLLIAGSFNSVGGISRSRIARLKPDGSLDGAFDPGQMFNAQVNSVAVQSDGKILVGGNFNKIGNTDRFGIARLNSDGTLDSTFAPSTSTTDFAGVKFIRRTADGRFIIAGSFDQVEGVPRPGLARLNANGSLDATFTPSGEIGSNLTAVELLPDGKVVIARNTNSTGTVSRLNADGSVDSAFKVTSLSGQVNALVVLADGRLLICGALRASSSQPSKLLVARLDADGSPDPTFTFNSQDEGYISAVAPLAGGKVLIAGRFQTVGGMAHLNLARLNSDGTPDASFDLAADDIGYPDIQFTPYPGGKVLVTGGFSTLAGMVRRRMAILNNDGTLDAAFVPALGLIPVAISVLPDGRILVTEGSQVMRLNTDGSPDFAFSFPVWSGAGDAKGTISSLLALPDGRAITGGAFYQAGVARTVRPLLAMFEAGGAMVRLPAVGVASAANYRPAVAGGSIISLFGTGLSSATVIARTNPLPTELNGVRVKFVPTYSAFNEDLLLPLFFVSEKQINCWLQYFFPDEGYLLVENNGAVVASTAINAVRIAPGIFTADASGKGYPAAQVLRVRVNGSQVYEPVVTRNAAGQLVGRPIDLGPEGEQVFLVLYGTGSSGAINPTSSATIGEVAAEIQYLGQAPGLFGVDQINLRIPRSLKGVDKDADVKLTVDGMAANTVQIYIQ